MISFGVRQLLLLLMSVGLIVSAMTLIARSRAEGSPRKVGWRARRAGILGFGSGVCLGTMAAWGRPIPVLLWVAGTLGLAMGLTTGAISRQVASLSQRARESRDRSELPEQPLGQDDRDAE